MSSKRPLKAHIAPPGDFIALGKHSKSSSSDVDLGKALTPKKLGVPPGKREASGMGGSSLVKKPKLIGQTFTPLGRSDVERKSSPAPTPAPTSQYEELAIDVDPQELLEEILDAEDTCDDERLEGLFCWAVKYLHGNRSKPDPAVYLTLMYLAKTKSSVFNSDVIIQAFCSLLKRDMSLNFKSKGNCLVSVCACSVLMAAFAKEENWPDDFVKVFVEDSLGERVWVDRADCKAFVDNIITAFNTNLPAKSAISVEQTSAKEQSGTASPVVGFLQDEDDRDSEVKISALVEMEAVQVLSRYPYQQETIEMTIMEVIKEQLNKRQPMDATSKNLIRFMTATCGYGEVRLLASQRLEMWLQNPKLARPAQDLLMSICMNCNQHDQKDLETMAILIKIRMKTKPLLNHFLNCLRELLDQHPENIRMIMTHTIYNELSNTRNPNNMAIITTLFQKTGEQSTRILAEVFQDLLANKEDYLRAVRGLFREIVRSLKHDINITAFCLGLMQERVETKFMDLDHNIRERYVMSIGDLVTQAIFLCITPQVREAATALSKGEKKDLGTLHSFRQQVALIQRDSVWWLHTIVPKVIEVKLSEYVHCLHKVLFMESADQYYNKDNWPLEADRSTFLHLATNVPVLEDTLMRVLVIGLSRELPLGQVDAVELADQLVKRAASLCLDGQVVLQMEKLELVDALLNLCSYRHPTDITLPKGYKPPTLAISNLYWKSWVILLILAAFNPRTFGLTGWKNYPTLKCLMEQVMTGNFAFPPPTMADDELSVEDISNKEKQFAQQERQQILEFETHLAAATSKVTITEANSLLISQLTTMDPNGIARNPPTAITEQLKLLNDNLRIGQMLCRSRQPDFLLDIIQRQGSSQSMSWLAELVESSEGSLEVLPVQCLCEFLLHDEETPSIEEDTKQMGKHKHKQKLRKREQLLHRLQGLVWGESEMTPQVLDYFLKRLSSNQAANRVLAIRGLSMVIAKDDAMETDDSVPYKWLCKDLPLIPMFPDVYPQITESLRQACQIETDPGLVSAYIMFLSQQTEHKSLHDLDDIALDIANLIVDRTTVVNHILPLEEDCKIEMAHLTLTALHSLYFNYLTKAKKPNKEAYSWSNTQDQILLQWEGGDSATMHVLVVHAMIILLTYGPPNGESDYQELLDTWFPESGQPPSAFLLDTSEEALLLPDWLKLRMIRSRVHQLVDVALQDIEPAQLLLFVQSFGIPVASMSRLFKCLDNAVAADPNLIEEAVDDKAYMAQLIEIQHMRGVVGGDIFYKLLTKSLVPKPESTATDEDVAELKAVSKKWSQRMESTKKPSTSNVTDLIVQIFSQEGVKKKEVQQEYHKLMMILSGSETATAIEVTQVLLEMLGGMHGPQFAKIFSRSPQTCSLLKLLVSKKVTLGGLLYKLMETLFNEIKGQRCMVTSIVNQYLLSNKPNIPERRPSYKSVKSVGSSSQALLDDLISQVQKDENNMEKMIKECMRVNTKPDDSLSAAETMHRTLTAVACKAIHKDTEEASNTMTTSMAILFVDWLELLDPELVAMVPDLQQQLLFANEKLKGLPSQSVARSSQPYLLTLLTHQSSWASLQRCINCLLQPAEVLRFSPTAVLDFLWACLQIPKIWRGRERRTPKNHTAENVLGLTSDQLIALIKYIVEESIQLYPDKEADDNKVSTERQSSIANRIDLLMLCIGENHRNLQRVVTFIRDIPPTSSYIQYQQLLVELYSQCPKVIAWLSDVQGAFFDGQFSQSTITQVDIVSHRLLTCLGQAGNGKTAEDKMYDANIACRKLASQHPLLMLRQLPLIAALLKGKTQFTFGEMRHKNYLLLFTHILGLMETLQPHIYRRDYTALADVIHSYFSLISAHAKGKQLGPIIHKYIKFLYQYTTHEPQQSSIILQKYVNLLSGISTMYPELSVLKSLLAGLTLSRQSESNQGNVASVTQPRSTSPWTVGQLTPFLDRLHMATDSEDILEVLTDLDETSKRKVDILEHFIGDLKKLLLHASDTARNTAYSLVMRYIRHNPRASEQFVGSFLHCFDSENPDIITSALKNLPEFCVLCQDHADEILQKSFIVGTTTAIETSSFISETLQLLNLETVQI
ncbi:integrator complex subunit 1-like isoform X2 [Ostrea edulis]|uniref:integrator complex subunit 1-like isoform X2 n=1 Tax=Ostrea edulis TaxID=37623 RepID=UPI0024AF5E34|nr:integrator complex subunit 1-like isoform X2 [Ostrea edulis]